MLDATAVARTIAWPSTALLRAAEAAAALAGRAGFRAAGPLPVTLLATALLTVPAGLEAAQHPSTAYLGLDVGAVGVLAFGVGAIAVLDSVTHRDRRGATNIMLGTALCVLTLARIVVWALGVEGHIPASRAAAADGWFFGTVVLAMAPLLAWGAVRRWRGDAQPGTGIAAALSWGALLGALLVVVAVVLWSSGDALLDHADDALGVAASVAALTVVVWLAHHGVLVRTGTRAGLVLAGVAGVAEAISAAPFDAYWYAAHAGLALALGCVFVGKARLLTDAMGAERQHLWELEVLNGAAARLAATLDVQELRDTVVAIAAEVLSPPGGEPRRAALIRAEDDRFEVVAERDDADFHLAGASFPQAAFPAWRAVVESGRAQVVDLGATPVAAGVALALSHSGLHGQMVAPVSVGGEVVGLLTAGTRAPYVFSAAEVAALRGIANLAALAFDNAWRYADEHRLVETLYRLAAANTAAARADDVDAMLQHVAHAAVELTGARSGAAVLLDEDGGVHVVTTREEERAVLERFAGELGAGRVAAPMPELRTPFRIVDVRRTGTPEILAALDASGVQALLVVPLLRKQVPVGVLYVADRQDGRPRDFGHNDEAVLVALAAHTMVAVENVEMMRRLEDAATVDPVTGLGNRREFERVRSLRPRTGFAVLAIDVDNLKVINDEAGHEAGDAVLRVIGSTLRHVARPDDHAMRTGGDEFALVVQGAGLDTGREIGERIRTALCAASVPHGLARVSIGVAAGEPGDEVDAVWTSADLHLYRAKASGRDRLVAAPIAAGSAPRWEDVVRSAFAPGGLRTVFQPVVDLRDGSVCGFEALSRPRSTPPGESVEGFFSAAQRLGMMRDVDWLCRRTALETAARLSRTTVVFVNVSTGALLDPVLGPDQLELLAASLGLDPGWIVLELTERELVPDLVRLTDVLESYRQLGFRFALDDVGTGRSTLGLLVAARPEFLKIAGDIVGAVGSVAADGLLDAAIAFAARTGAEVIAEGIEDESLAAHLVRRGVRLGQGYGLHRPMEVEAARRLVEPGR